MRLGYVMSSDLLARQYNRDMPNAVAKTLMPNARRRRCRLAAAFCVMLIIGVLSLELFCRFYLGLGDPPLSIADAEIEYLFSPNQTCRRFGNLVHYNGYSMRSDDFGANKADPNEYRVMVFGDSVVNGGALTDQSRLATTLLQKDLSARLNRPVVVGNISAGSWGPPNMLAYAKRYGFFEADAVVIVLSAHDYADIPTFAPIVGVNPDFPSYRPWCATWEALTRYLPRYLGRRTTPDLAIATKPSQESIAACDTAISELIERAQVAGAQVAVLQHLNQEEIAGGVEPGHEHIRSLVASMNVARSDVETPNTNVLGDYRDTIHLNDKGQLRLEKAMFNAMKVE